MTMSLSSNLTETDDAVDGHYNCNVLVAWYLKYILNAKKKRTDIWSKQKYIIIKGTLSFFF